MNPKLKTLISVVAGAILGIVIFYLFSNYKIEKNNPSEKDQTEIVLDKDFQILEETENPIASLTKEESVISYVKSNHKLPDYYITKSGAKNQGWNPSQGNLCDVLPGKAIGGDKFSNREKQLPKGGQYYEADVNYNCGNRGADRIVFTKNGEVWLTKNHYKSFKKK